MRTFVAETVFSHESKLELVKNAQQRGFRVILYHIHVSTPDLAKARVATRIHQGGHSVPADKIEARFDRTLRLIPRAAACADVTLVFDNSGREETTHTHVLTLERAQVVKIGESLPEWVERAYAEPILRYREALAGR
jgi:predicted ABC-type ATPase